MGLISLWVISKLKLTKLIKLIKLIKLNKLIKLPLSTFHSQSILQKWHLKEIIR